MSGSGIRGSRSISEHPLAAGLILGLLVAAPACAGGPGPTTTLQASDAEDPDMSEPRGGKPNVAAPEPVTFLGMAIEAMHDFHQDHGAFATAWHQLDISFAAGPFYEGDEGTVPTEEDGADWQPKDCTHRYVIESASADAFRIIAVGPDGEVAYQATQTDTEPRRLGDAEEEAPPQK